jgi:hypothetical protein
VVDDALTPGVDARATMEDVMRLPGSSFEPMLVLTVVVLALVAWGNDDLSLFTRFADDTVRSVASRIGVDL